MIPGPELVPARRREPHPARRRAGFTLLELAAVIVMMLLLVGMVLPSFGIGSRRALEGEAEGLRSELELARQRAIATGAPHRVSLDLDRSTLRLERFAATPPPAPSPPERGRPEVDLSPPRSAGGSFEPVGSKLGRERSLDEDVFVARVETAEGATRQGRVGISFFEDGSASAARIRLENLDGEAIELEVLPLADAVRARAVR